MKIAFTTKGRQWDSPMDPRFGRTAYFMIYDDEKDELTHYDNCGAANDAHGAGPKTSQKLFELHADVLITGNSPGGNAAAVLQKMGIKIFIGAGDKTAKEAFEAFKNNKLKSI